MSPKGLNTFSISKITPFQFRSTQKITQKFLKIHNIPPKSNKINPNVLARMPCHGRGMDPALYSSKESPWLINSAKKLPSFRNLHKMAQKCPKTKKVPIFSTQALKSQEGSLILTINGSFKEGEKRGNTKLQQGGVGIDFLHGLWHEKVGSWLVFFLFRLSWVERGLWLLFVCRMQMVMGKKQLGADWERERRRLGFCVWFLVASSSFYTAEFWADVGVNGLGN